MTTSSLDNCEENLDELIEVFGDRYPNTEIIEEVYNNYHQYYDEVYRILDRQYVGVYNNIEDFAEQMLEEALNDTPKVISTYFGTDSLCRWARDQHLEGCYEYYDLPSGFYVFSGY